MAKFFTPSRISENIRETPEGYLLCLGVPIARTGWQEYGPGETPLEVGEDGLVWVQRDSKEVFRPQTIASFQGKSVTIKHPNDFVEPKNWKILTHGVVQNVRKGEEKDEDGEEQLLADLLITDEFTIGLVQNGLREVSCGYDAEYEQTGEGEGRQFNIIGNHIALVEQGRAGSSYAIKDHKGKVSESMPTLKEVMDQIKALGKTADAINEANEKLAAKKKAKVADAEPEQVTFDDVMKAVKDLGEKIEGQAKKEHISDDDEEEMPPKKKKEESEDEEGDIDARLTKLEAAIAMIMKKMKGGAEDEDEEEDMSGDEDESEDDAEEEESEDDDYVADEEGEEGEESQKKTGDAAKFEILTPGKKYKGKDARSECLKVFAKTEDGKKVLKSLGLKKTIDSKTDTDMLFLAASALVKKTRGTGLQGTKDSTKWKVEDLDNTATESMTAEQMNELNAKHYGSAK